MFSKKLLLLLKSLKVWAGKFKTELHVKIMYNNFMRLTGEYGRFPAVYQGIMLRSKLVVKSTGSRL